MKLLIALLGLFLFDLSDDQILILDKDLKKPVRTCTEFSEALYLQHNFPVYAADVNAIIEATDVAVKYLDKKTACFSSDTIRAAHTMLIISTDCINGLHNASASLITKVTESNSSFGFTVATKEMNKRKVQQKLLDFATYLSQ